jgi:SapC
MPNIARGKFVPVITPLSRELHTNKRWLRYNGYSFTAADTICPLVVLEVTKAMLSLPIAFIPQKDVFALVALQGLEQGKNLLLTADGRWRTGYVPAQYRSYPFLLATSTDNQEILCVNEDSGLIVDGPGGEAFFDDTGSPTPAVSEIVTFLTQMASNRPVTAQICAQLQQYQLLQPWPINVMATAGPHNVEGLYRIDEPALNKLPADDLMILRNSGALLTAYCQLLSMQHLPALTKVLIHEEQVATKQMPKKLDLDFLNDSGNISFG